MSNYCSKTPTHAAPDDVTSRVGQKFHSQAAHHWHILKNMPLPPTIIRLATIILMPLIQAKTDGQMNKFLPTMPFVSTNYNGSTIAERAYKCD